MHSYEHLYRHLLGDISSHDFDLLQKAEYSHSEEIDPRKAHDPRVSRILHDIQSAKYHREEAAFGCI